MPGQEIRYLDLVLLLWTGGFCLIWAIGLCPGPGRGADPAAIGLVAISGLRLLWECYFLSGFALIYSLWIPLRRAGEGATAILILPGNIRSFAFVLLSYVWIMILADIVGYYGNVEILYRYSTFRI